MCGIEHKKSLLQRGVVHAGAKREIVRVLRATVQHHHKRQRLTCATGRDEQFVIARTVFVGVSSSDKLPKSRGVIAAVVIFDFTGLAFNHSGVVKRGVG